MDKAELIGADLSDADFSGSSLVSILARSTDLSRILLEGADLSEANLTSAILSDAKLQYAELTSAILDQAVLENADLSGAVLSGASLENARLENANLRNCLLLRTELEGADLSRADVLGAVYQATSHPRLPRFAEALNLAQMRIAHSSARDKSRIVDLRSELQKAGYFEAARRVNAAIWRTSDPGAFGYLFLDLTCEYGANLWRPLKAFLVVVLVFMLPNLYFAWQPRGNYLRRFMLRLNRPKWRGVFGRKSRQGRLYVVFSRKVTGDRTLYRKQQIAFSASSGLLFPKATAAMCVALIMSLMSAFNLSFRDLHFGQWIKMLSCGKFEIEPAGWAKFYSGLQSLISLYLLVLFVFSFLGTPFFRY